MPDVEPACSREGIDLRLKILGIILVLVGLIWVLQGAGILGGSFMTGQSQWLYIGIVVAVAGVALFAWGMRRRSVG